MRRAAGVLSVFFLSSCLCLAGGADHGIGFGYTGGTLEEDDVDGELDFTGFTVFGKIGFTSNWGLLISWRSMEDDENFPFDGSIEYDQVAAHAVYMWRSEKVVRPHVKFGIVNTDVEISLAGESASEDETSFSFGGGLEAGSERVAFFGDFDYTDVEFDNVDFQFANATLGVIFKF